MKGIVGSVMVTMLITLAAAGPAAAASPSPSPTPHGPSSGWNAGAVWTTIIACGLLGAALVTVFVRRRRGLFE